MQQWQHGAFRKFDPITGNEGVVFQYLIDPRVSFLDMLMNLIQKREVVFKSNFLYRRKGKSQVKT